MSVIVVFLRPLGLRLPEKVLEKIVEGKLKKFFEDSCLLNQAYVRNPDITVGDLLNDLIGKMGKVGS